MAEEVGNFPQDFKVNPSALRGLEQSSEEVGRPLRHEDGEEDLRNPGRARESAAEEERDVARPDRIEDRVEITQDAFDQNQAAERNRAGTQTEKVRQVVDQQEVDQQESIQGQAVAERHVKSEDALQRNQKESTPNNTGDSAQVAGPGDSDPEESLDEGFQLGNTQTNPNRTENFPLRNQIDNPEKAAAATNNLDSNLTSQTRDAQNEGRNANNDVPNEPEASRNEPPLDIPEANVEQVEKVQEPLQEAQGTNPLRAPRASEIRDEPDATAIETERGQNVSSLI